MTETSLTKLVRLAWSAETSYDSKRWRASNPAWGQCCVTALAVQHHLGGDLVRVTYRIAGKAAVGHHYYNILPDGKKLDLTREQFAGKQVTFGDPEIRTRSKVLASSKLRYRYKVFWARMEGNR